MLHHTRVIGKYLWISRQLHDKLLLEHNLFFQDNLCIQDSMWNIFGKGIPCDDEKSAHNLRHRIHEILGWSLDS
jgi:hypothetical protein